MYTLAHLRLLLNHWPSIVSLLGLLLVALAWWRRSEPTGRMGLAFLVGAALVGAALAALLPAYTTREDAGHAVERAPGVTEAIIARHADAPLVGSLALGALGLFALRALWRYRRPATLPPWVLTTALGGATSTSAAARSASRSAGLQ